MRVTSCFLALAAALAAFSAHGQTQSQPNHPTHPSTDPSSQTPPTSRAEATAIIADARKILTPNGVQRLEKIRIGGIDQWVFIRGVDRRNPVLVLLHGGPGYLDMPISWWFGRGWEEYFTVVYWDQRAAGKTYLLTDPAKVAPTLALDRMLVRYARPIAERAGDVAP